MTVYLLDAAFGGAMSADPGANTTDTVPDAGSVTLRRYTVDDTATNTALLEDVPDSPKSRIATPVMGELDVAWNVMVALETVLPLA